MYRASTENEKRTGNTANYTIQFHDYSYADAKTSVFTMFTFLIEIHENFVSILIPKRFNNAVANCILSLPQQIRLHNVICIGIDVF